MEQDKPADQGQIASELKAMSLSLSATRQDCPANMTLIYDYLSDGRRCEVVSASARGTPQFTNNPGFTTTAPEAVIRKATMLSARPRRFGTWRPAAPCNARSERPRRNGKTSSQSRPRRQQTTATRK